MSENGFQLPMIFDADQKIESASEMNKSNIFDSSETSGDVVSLSDYLSEKESIKEAEEQKKIYQSILNRAKHLV